MNFIKQQNIPNIPSGYVKVTDPSHENCNEYGKIVKRAPVMVNDGAVYVQVELINSGTIIALRDAQYRKTDIIQEVRRVNASS
ncbi:hypothetical protein M405DRAFT_935310 [Rhizopogon salebrosus TDB-379]|nr:hypothetical protein M405DRAFT_935310 [Rhizopogon salebrosus TDB-379]